MKKIFLSLCAGLLLSATVYAQDTSLSLDSFYAKMEREEKPLIVDARSADEYALNHVQGAVNYPGGEAGEHWIETLERSKPVFIYSIANARSGQLARNLRSRGFAQVYDLKGGIAAWVGGGKSYFTTALTPRSWEAYKTTVAQNKLVLVDIGSRYCGACKKVKPVLDSLRQQHGDKLSIVELELEESPQLIAQLKTVTAFPYLILYRNGSVVFSRSGQGDLRNEVAAEVVKLNPSVSQSQKP